MLDLYTRVKVLNQTLRPNLLCYMALHQDYSEGAVYDEIVELHQLDEKVLGNRLIKHCVKNNHWGPTEHPSITFNVIGYPHSVLVQMRTHRIGVSFDCQCLAGESLITKSNGKTVSIAKLYQQQMQGRNKLPKLRNLNEKRMYFEEASIGEVFRNSPKSIYLVTLEDGKQLRCSMQHRIHTPEGWMRLEDLAIGDLVTCNGSKTLSSNYGVKKSIRKAREFYTNADWLENFEVLCASCHKKEHKSLKPHAVAIKSIEFLRKDVTYDIEITGDYHNFVCDGIVVHNSQRYTGERIIKVVKGELSFDSVFYLRPVGDYFDREGNKYHYSAEDRNADKLNVEITAEGYADNVKNKGYAPEHARDMLAQAIRQNFVVTVNARSFLHIADMRIPKDAQLEIRDTVEEMFKLFEQFMPELAAHYKATRYGKNKLAP